MQDLFAKIIAGEIPCVKVYEDDYVFAFLDHIPTNPGHTLVVPKKWSSDLLDTDEETLKHLIVAIQKISKAVKAATGAGGINIHQNNGEIAGQKVFHLHFHIIPRHEGDGYELWHGKPYGTPEEAREMGERVRNEIQ